MPRTRPPYSPEFRRQMVELVALVGAILLEQNDEWSVQRARYMTLETITALSDDPVVNPPLMRRAPLASTPKISAGLPPQ